MVFARTRPVKVPFFAQPLTAHAAQVARPTRCQQAELVPHLGTVGVVETGQTPLASEAGEDLPIGQGVTGSVEQFRTMADEAFAARAGPLLLAPRRGGQQHIGE